MSSEQLMQDIPVPESLEDLKKLIIERIESKCAALPEWHWKDYDTVDLQSLAKSDSEKVQKLLFGQSDSVIGDWSERNWESIADLADGNIKPIREEVIETDLKDVIAAYAEANDIDPDDLCEELKEDEDLQQSNLDVPSAYTEYTYRYSAAVVATAPFSLTFTPGSELFNALTWLRIEPQAYLDACIAFMESKELTLDDQGPFKDAISLIDEEESFESLALAYRHAFWEAKEKCSDASLYAELHIGEPLVAPSDLVTFMDEAGDASTLYVHAEGDSDTVENVSNEIQCHDLDRQDTILEAHGALIATERKPGYIDARLDLKGPLPIPLSAWSVEEDGPETDNAKVTLNSEIEPEVTLYRALIKASDADEKADKTKQIDTIKALALSVPPHRALEMANKLQIFADRDVAHLAEAAAAVLLERASAPLDDQLRTRGLLECLAPCNDMYSGQVPKAMWLIEKGADVNAATEHGVTPLMLAARLRKPDLVGALLEAGADVSAQAQEPLTGTVENATLIAGRPLTRGNRPRDGAECLELLISSGGTLPEGDVRFGRDQSFMLSALRFAVSTGHPGLVRAEAERLFPKTNSEHKDQLIEALCAAGRNNDVESGCVLVEFGAKVDDLLPGKTRTVAEAIAQSERSGVAARETPRADAFSSMMRASTAKNAIDSILIAAGRKPSP